MADDISYYELLGVPPDASESDIKRGYKRAAVKWHPDKNDNKEEATEMFKLVAEAYAVLSDPAKRTAYDRYGRAGVTGQGLDADEFEADHDEGGPHRRRRGRGRGYHASVDINFAEDIFRSFFGGQDPFAAMGMGVGMGTRRGVGMFGDPFPFADPFFSDGFGGGGGGMGMFGGMAGFGSLLGGGGFSSSSSSFSTSTAAMGGLGMSSVSSSTVMDSRGGSTTTQTETFVQNGQQVTRVTRSVRHPDGRVETSRSEHSEPIAALPASHSDRPGRIDNGRAHQADPASLSSKATASSTARASQRTSVPITYASSYNASSSMPQLSTSPSTGSARVLDAQNQASPAAVASHYPLRSQAPATTFSAKTASHTAPPGGIRRTGTYNEGLEPASHPTSTPSTGQVAQPQGRLGARSPRW